MALRSSTGWNTFTTKSEPVSGPLSPLKGQRKVTSCSRTGTVHSLMTAFLVKLDDFKGDISGWRADVLRLPTATVTRVFADGMVLDARLYRADAHTQLVYWTSTEAPPAEIVIEVCVTDRLTSIKTPIVVAAIGALATVMSAWLAKDSAPACAPLPNVAVCRDHLSRLRMVVDHSPTVEGLKSGAVNVLDHCKSQVDAIDEGKK